MRIERSRNATRWFQPTTSYNLSCIYIRDVLVISDLHVCDITQVLEIIILANSSVIVEKNRMIGNWLEKVKFRTEIVRTVGYWSGYAQFHPYNLNVMNASTLEWFNGSNQMAAQLVEYRASNWKVRSPGSTPDAIARCVPLRRFHHEAKQSTRRGGPALQKTANRTVLCWSGMTDTEHNVPYDRRRIQHYSERHGWSLTSEYTVNKILDFWLNCCTKIDKAGSLNLKGARLFTFSILRKYTSLPDKLKLFRIISARESGVVASFPSCRKLLSVLIFSAVRSVLRLS